MPIDSEHVINGVTQERNLVTELPGPRSQALLARKADAVSSGVGIGLPVFVTKAGVGIVVDADGNALSDLGSVNPTVSQSEQMIIIYGHNFVTTVTKMREVTISYKFS